jgi:hypothetical protein
MFYILYHNKRNLTINKNEKYPYTQIPIQDKFFDSSLSFIEKKILKRRSSLRASISDQVSNPWLLLVTSSPYGPLHLPPKAFSDH